MYHEYVSRWFISIENELGGEVGEYIDLDKFFGLSWLARLKIVLYCRPLFNTTQITWITPMLYCHQPTLAVWFGDTCRFVILRQLTVKERLWVIECIKADPPINPLDPQIESCNDLAHLRTAMELIVPDSLSFERAVVSLGSNAFWATWIDSKELREELEPFGAKYYCTPIEDKINYIKKIRHI